VARSIGSRSCTLLESTFFLGRGALLAFPCFGAKTRCSQDLLHCTCTPDAPVDFAQVERFIRASIKSAEENMASKSQLMHDLKSDEQMLEKKIQKKGAELDRNKKRLMSLQTVRPAFMDEYENMEADLQDMFR
jgi:hypothetical protein